MQLSEDKDKMGDLEDEVKQLRKQIDIDSKVFSFMNARFKKKKLHYCYKEQRPVDHAMVMWTSNFLFEYMKRVIKELKCEHVAINKLIRH